MALHPDFPDSPHEILDPTIRWFPADEALRETGMEKLMPPLVAALRVKVKEFRDSGYVGASDTSKSLLNWWFNTPHLLPQADGNMAEFKYFFSQREALETIIYLYDVVGAKDKFDLMRFDSSGAVSASMFDETWRRYVVKMATGAGKTKVLSLALAWSYFHKLYEPDSELARNFLLIAPNIIVLDRIYKDFEGLRLFYEDPVIPDNGFDGRNWHDDFQLTLHLQDEVRVTQPTGNIFLTNIHRVYAGEDIPPTADDDDTMDFFLGTRPTGGTTDSKVDLGMIVRDIDELMVLNDEAHHIHDARLAWFKSIEDKRSLFNRVIGDSHLELRFASFLEGCTEVQAYAKNYFAVHFKIDYVNADGSISNYYPDFIVKLKDGRVFVVETKGQEDLDVPLKMERLRQWCEDTNSAQSEANFDFVYVDEESFEKYKPKSFSQLTSSFVEYKEQTEI